MTTKPPNRQATRPRSRFTHPAHAGAPEFTRPATSADKGAMSDLISEAQAIATRVHDGQTDKAGADYVTHPARVAELVRAAGGSEHAIATAWLHDVLAKTDLTPYDLLSSGIPEDVVHAVEAVTMREGEGVGDYFARLAESSLAVQVKHADLDEKSSQAWVGIPDQKARQPVDAGIEPTPEPVDDAPTFAPEPVDDAPTFAPEPVDDAPTFAPEPVDDAPTFAPEPVDDAPTFAPQPVDDAHEPLPRRADAGYEAPSELLDSGYDPAHEAFDPGYYPGGRVVDESPW
jgi:hypothetical protein